MADVRNLTIGVAFNVNAGGLKEADESISRLVQSAKALDAAGSAGFLKISNGAKKSAESTQDLADGAKKAEAQLKDVANAADKLGSDTAEGAKKAANGVKDLANAGQKAGNDVSAGATKATDAMNKTKVSAESTRNALKEAGSYGKQMGADVDSGTSKAVSGLTRLIDKAKSVHAALGKIGSGIGKIPEALGVGYNGEREGKIMGAIKESAAMFAPGFLIANGVMSLADKAKEEIGAGYDYTKEQSGMGGTWKTLVNGTRSEGVSAAQAGSAGSIVKTINDQSRDTGRSLELVNEASQQTYHATDSAGRTSHLVQSELRIADAMGLSDANAQNFAITGVGHALDLGKVSSGSMNVMSLYAPAVKYAVARVLAAQANHESIDKVTEEEQKKYAQQLGGKKGLLAQGKVSAEDLETAINYLGDTKFRDAAKNAMQTLPGMTRSIENGLPRIMSSFEKSLFKPMAGRAQSVMMSISKWFTSDKSEQEAADFGKNLSKVTSYLYDNGKKIATAMAPFAKGFGKGLIDGLHDLQSAWTKASKMFSGIGKTIDGFVSKHPVLNQMFGKETIHPTQSSTVTIDHGKETLMKAGEIAGVATVMGLVTKLATKLPAIGGPLQKAIDVVGKIPVLGSTLKHVPGVKSLFSGKNPFGDNNKALDANTAAVNANTRAQGGQAAGEGLGGSGSESKKGAKTAAEESVEKTVVKDGEEVVEDAGKTGLLKRLGGGLSRFIGAGTLLDTLNGGNLNKLGGQLSKDSFIGRGIKAIGEGGKNFGKSVFGFTKEFSHVGAKGALDSLKTAGGLIKESGVGKLLGGVGEKLGGPLGVGLDALDLYSDFKMKNGRAKDKAFGSSIGGIVGTAAGSFLGPLGMIAGGFLGSKAGEFVGEHAQGIKKWTTGAVKDTGKFLGEAGKEIGQDWNGLQKWNKKYDNWGFVGKELKSAGSGIGKAFSGSRKEVDKLANGMSKLGIAGKLAAEPIKFYNHPIKTAESSVKNLSKGFSKVGKVSKSAFNGVSTAVKSGLSKAKSTAAKDVKGIESTIKSGLKSAGNSAKSAFNTVASSVKSGLSKAKSTAKSEISGIKSDVSSGLKSVESVTKSTMSSFSSAFNSGLSKAKSVVSNGVSGIKSAVATGMSGVKAAVQIGVSAFQAFGSTVSGVIGGVKSAVSGLVGAVQSAASGIASALGHIHMPHLAAGTPGAKSAFRSYAAGGGHPGGLARVNDAAGSTWRESFMLPNGLVGIFPKKRDLVVPLPSGTQVLDAVSTQKKFGNSYATGTPGAVEAFNNLTASKPKSSNGVTIQIQPQFNITVGNGMSLDQIQKQVETIIKPFLDMMAQSLQAKLV